MCSGDVADGGDDRGEGEAEGERVERRAGDRLPQGGGRRDRDAREDEDERPDQLRGASSREAALDIAPVQTAASAALLRVLARALFGSAPLWAGGGPARARSLPAHASERLGRRIAPYVAPLSSGHFPCSPGGGQVRRRPASPVSERWVEYSNP